MVQLLGILLPIAAVIITIFLGFFLKGGKRWAALGAVPGIAFVIMYVFGDDFLFNGNALFLIEAMLYNFLLMLYYPVLVIAGLVAFFRKKNIPPSASEGEISHSAPIGRAWLALLAYSGPFVIILFLKNLHRDPFVKFHIRQGFLCWAAIIVIALGRSVLGGDAGIGEGALMLFVNLGMLAVILRGMANAYQGKAEPVPVIGRLIS